MVLKDLISGQWHLWDYRNKRFRGPDGRTDQEEHAQLNARIDAEFRTGWQGMTLVCEQTFAQGQTPADVKAMSRSKKQAWLDCAVAVGRKRLQPPPAQQTPYARERELMENWVTPQ